MTPRRSQGPLRPMVSRVSKEWDWIRVWCWSRVLLLSILAPRPVGGQEVVLDASCGGPVLVRTGHPEESPAVCDPRDHLEWWEECAAAILNATRRPAAPKDPWSVVRQMEPWAPEGRFAERFVAECEALRSAALARGLPLVQPGRLFSPHDPSRCPCTKAEHQEWVEGCLAEIDAILPGMRRWEVMERFGEDGGISIPGKTRLRHCTCPFLKVDVEFDLAPGQTEESPRDIVESVGTPYLEYPISD